jgi:hypothetical protein
MPPTLPDLADEFMAADLGDQRRDRRLVLLAEQVQQYSTGSEAPIAFGRGAELEAAYRFLNNEAVEAEAIAEPHVGATVARCSDYERVIVVHDTTEFAFSGEREGMYKLNGKRRGFCGHFSIAVAGDGSRRPLGLLAYATLERAVRNGRSWQENFNDPQKESLRWFKGAKAASAVLAQGAAKPVHVMDREGDSYELFAALIAAKSDFVVRSNHDRRIVDDAKVLSQALAGAEVRTEREVHISARESAESPAKRKKHPGRDQRVAHLAMRGAHVELRRPHHIRKPSTLPINVVEVREEDVPEGQEAVVWRLLTTLPIDTAEQILDVVDIYRTRWLIEEFFKALKTGCGFLRRQHESREALERLLMILVAQAWRLLLIRWIGRDAPTTPAHQVVTPTQLACLQQMVKYTKLSKKPTAGEVLLAVAELGGHLPQNGSPGWIVLGRGLDVLAAAEVGWEAAMRNRAQRAMQRMRAKM